MKLKYNKIITSVSASRWEWDAIHGVYQLCVVAVNVQTENQLRRGAERDDAHSGERSTNVKNVDRLLDEFFNTLEIVQSNTARGIDNEHNVCDISGACWVI